MRGFRPRIAIAGGGPSGLALSLLLRRYGIGSTVYELRHKPRPEELAEPSGMLDLHEESGLTVMRECGLWEGFQAKVGDCSEAMRVLRSDGVEVHADDGRGEPRPEIPRHGLIRLLAEKLPDDAVRWGSKVAAVRRSRNPETDAVEATVELAGSDSATYDLVIGADGAWSRVRALVSDTKPAYCGTQLVTATLRHASAHDPDLVDLSGSGSLWALGHGNALMTQRGPQDSIRVYAAISSPDEHWASAVGLRGRTTSEAKTFLLGPGGPFSNWASPLQHLLATVCDADSQDHVGRAVDVMPLYALPAGHLWSRNGGGATLIGDAAHLMLPFAGEGVNLALWDALDLARLLAEVSEAADAKAWQAGLEPRLRAMEERMQARAQKKSEEARRNKEMMLGDGAADVVAAWFRRHQGSDG
ncbi:hypothetical protein XA68_12797 [Ophiocordyceps unilateralis]|uniref:FAD-binding domain-containing protein n=1 Tax=Ophiocordyceps unilateralis TaxID=268505 RepID=A0A2A9PE53_OPHUN|nr:hypothetical protein XA68_12797 [Ophiocordyceps unilateralis]